MKNRKFIGLKEKIDC